MKIKTKIKPMFSSVFLSGLGLSLIIETTLAQTATTIPQEIDTRIKTAEDHCLKRDWEKEQCHFQPIKPSDYPYNRTVGDSLNSVKNLENRRIITKAFEDASIQKIELEKSSYEGRVKASEYDLEMTNTFYQTKENLILANRAFTQKQLEITKNATIPNLIQSVTEYLLKKQKEEVIRLTESLKTINQDILKNKKEAQKSILTKKIAIDKSKLELQKFLVNYDDFYKNKKQYADSAVLRSNRFSDFKSELLEKTKNLNLNQCQKSCLMKCMTSQLISYDIKEVNDQSSKDFEYFFKGKGVCTAFSVLGESLQNAIGINSMIMTKSDEKAGNHAYIMVNIDGNRYYAEPQSEQCTYYHFEH